MNLKEVVDALNLNLVQFNMLFDGGEEGSHKSSGKGENALCDVARCTQIPCE